MTVFFAIFGLALLLPMSIKGGPDAPPLGFTILWLVVVVGWFGFNVVRAPYRVTVEADGRVIFDRLVGRFQVPATEIRSVRRFWVYSAIVETNHGNIWLRVFLSEMFDFLNRLRELNPGLQVRGL